MRHNVQPGAAQELKSAADALFGGAAEREPVEGFAGAARYGQVEPSVDVQQLPERSGADSGPVLSWQPQLIGVSRHTAVVTDFAAEIRERMMDVH